MVFFGYVGTDETATDKITEGLVRLQNLGYDSVGMVVCKDAKMHIRKKTGRVQDLVTYISHSPLSGTYGIGHLRWATHGAAGDTNAHPQVSNNGRIAIAHNGVVENEAALRKQLKAKNYKFSSETDTEVIANLIEDVMTSSNVSLSSALPIAMGFLTGANAVIAIDKDEAGVLVAGQSGSSFMVGFYQNGGTGHYISSNIQGFPPETKNIITINNREYITLTPTNYEIKTFDEVVVQKEVQEMKHQLDRLDKGDFPDFVLKEIHEQPKVLRDCLRGRLTVLRNNEIHLGGLGDSVNGMPIIDHCCNANRVIIVASGSSYNAALLGKTLIETMARVNVQVEYATEFRRQKRPFPNYSKPAVMLAMSQSGETGDVIACLNKAKEAGLVTIGLVNTAGSTIANMTDGGLFLRAGVEVGVTSTKTFTLQAACLTMIAILMGQHRKTLTSEEATKLLDALEKVPDQQEELLTANASVFKDMARTYRFTNNFLYLGRGYNYAIAMEGATKLTQLSYIHCEAYPAAEMKHGPIALIDEFMPVLFISMRDAVYDKVINNIREVRARKGAVIAITDMGNTDLEEHCDFVVKIPHTHDALIPLLTALPVQMLAYELGVIRKCSVDHPRHQTKCFANDTA